MDTITIQRKIAPARTGHCQLHGDPYDIAAGTFIRYTLPSGKRRSFQMGESVTNEQIIQVLKSHPKNLKNYEFKFIDWIESKVKHEL